MKQDQRSDPRFRPQSAVAVTLIHRDDIHSAELVDFSRSGACLKTASEFEPGFTVFMRSSNYSHVTPTTEPTAHTRFSTLGEVKWCRARGRRGTVEYTLGLKYLMFY